MSNRRGILVVDDSGATLRLLTEILMAEGYAVRPTNSGEHGLAAARAEPPELILLDVRMPVMDGFEVCRRLKAEEATRDIPVLFLSAGTELEERVHCFEAGGVDFIPKPFQRAEFLARIRTHLELGRLRTRLEGLVQQRTAELHEANEQLHRELVERRRAEETLRRSESSLARAQAVAHLGNWEWDIATDLVTCSHEMLRICELEPETFHGQLESVLRVVHPHDRPTLDQALAKVRSGEAPEPFDVRVVRRDGRIRVIQVYFADVRRGPGGRPLCASGTCQDVTERRDLELKLLQAQKMEAIGQLAGGVAHDFNNILTVITGYASLLSMDPRLADGQRRKVEQIVLASERAMTVTRGLLAFGRTQLADLRVLDLNDVVGGVERFLTRIIGEDVRFRSALHPSPLLVKVDRGQWEQVLVNLAANARDAMPGGGDLDIRTGWEELDAPLAQARGLAGPGRYAVLTVTDTGIGMEESVRNSIFEPFFTTKPVGRGTGLGMSIVQGIIRQHRASIEVQSAPGQGTTFRIHLPLSEDDRAVETSVAAVGVSRGRGECILVADDDDSIRELLEELLEGQGYRVVPACDGRDALEKYRLHAATLSLVLLDMVMPGTSGGEAGQALRHLDPALPILYLSGHPAEFQEGSGGGPTDVIRKPIQPRELLAKVRTMLDREALVHAEGD